MIISRFSFGDAAAIVTSMALIIGLDAATATKPTIIGGLLIVALADNLTDSLSITSTRNPNGSNGTRPLSRP